MLITGTIIVAVAIIAGFSYYKDYYEVFHGAEESEIKNEGFNERFVKMEYLLKDNRFQKYDSYLCGSSRIMKTDPDITGLETYNIGVSSALPDDCLLQLKVLLKNQAPVKVLYYGLDDFTYTSYWEQATHSINRVPYKINPIENWGYYFQLLTDFGNFQYRVGAKINRIFKHKGNQSTQVKTMVRQSGVFIMENGMYIVPEEIERNIEENPYEYINQEKFMQPCIEFPELDRKSKDISQGNEIRFRECMSTIKKIKQLCDENHIRFVPFFNPHHMTTYLNDDMELMNRFKKELVKISPFWDFSGVNYVTSNNYFWYETSHPRAFICDKILDTVSGQNQMTWVPDFGVYVTEENVDAFCEKAVRDREAYDPNHEQWVPSAEERAVMTKRVNYPW